MDPWYLMQEGRVAEARQQLTSAIQQKPSAPLYANRGISFLLTHSLECALADFEKEGELFPNGDAAAIFRGVVLWWVRREGKAIETWRSAVNAGYTDPAGGVEIPALLFFAASRIANRTLEQEARTWLQERWNPRLALVWPGPIAGFLLGEMDDETFLRHQTFHNPTLEARRRTKTHFWYGLKLFRDGDTESYLHNLRQASKQPEPPTLAVALEPEYWLAKAELELVS